MLFLTMPYAYVLDNSSCERARVQTLSVTADPYVMDVIPQGATAAYASPELLESLQMQFVGQDSPSALQINGSAADWWSSGVVVYEVLTGELPFDGVRAYDVSSEFMGESVTTSFSLLCQPVLKVSMHVFPTAFMLCVHARFSMFADAHAVAA